MPRCAVNGARLHYERHGRGEPVLLVTGFAISGAVFEPVLGAYTDRFECILYDHRGTGRSGGPARPTSIPQLAADAAGLLAALGVESAHVHGVSMGGMVAQELALRFPHRVRGLVLGATTPGGPRAARPAAGELAALLAAAVDGRRGEWLAGALFSEAFRHEHPQRVRELLAYFGRHPPSRAAVLAQWWATVYHDTTSRLGQIRAPTLVVHGDADTLTPVANARMLAARIPGAELALVPGAGHAYALEQPEVTHRLVCDWFERRGPIPAGAPRTGLTARAEPLTRPFGLPVGAARTGASLAVLAADRVKDRLRGRSADVAVDR
ncbi:MAG TPA: alpha/beta fold hydrolase [Solirubrobacteraceae bacterium]|nr:alpha/beta fold hydrolase [Solirubrobacteraceae bacterium]